MYMYVCDLLVKNQTRFLFPVFKCLFFSDRHRIYAYTVIQECDRTAWHLMLIVFPVSSLLVDEKFPASPPRSC
jgi:hypothetical protein